MIESSIHYFSAKFKNMELVFATNNKHKLEELQSLLGDKIKLLSLKDIGCQEDIPEEQPTLEGNANQKSTYVYKKYGAMRLRY